MKNTKGKTDTTQDDVLKVYYISAGQTSFLQVQWEFYIGTCFYVAYSYYRKYNCSATLVSDVFLDFFNQNCGMMRVWITWQVQVFADIREQLKYNWFSMSGWQYGEQHILAIYDCEQGFLLMFGKTFNLWKTLLEYWRQNFFEDTVRNIIHAEHRRIFNVYTENWSILQTNFFPGREAKFTSKSAVTDIPTVPSVLPIKRTNHIDLRVCKNINQSEPEDQILTLASAWKWDSSPR